MKGKPEWVSQLGRNKLFGKLPTDLYRLWSANFVGHNHRDTMLFKKSIREQRIRFYGVEELTKIVYGNSRKARDPPAKISGDETITRLYIKKATDIRMRTRKKNESGALNQNLCGSNEGYATWKKGDPKGGGRTYANLTYPGSRYNRGSMFREKDIGNLSQLLFSCGDYFRYRNTELVTDSHFGHLVPLSYLRLWKVFATSSFTASTRIGVNIPELDNKELSETEKKDLWTSTIGREVLKNIAKISSDSDENIEEWEPLDEKDESPNKTTMKRVFKTRLKLFETYMNLHKKGFSKVWKTMFSVGEVTKVTIFLHAIKDSKICYRISTRYGGLPKVAMTVTDRVENESKKKKLVVQTTGAHKCFRLNMGFNDQSDAKRHHLGLSAKEYKSWPQHILGKLLEDVIINGYCDYLIDPSCKVESWPDFIYWLVDELLESGEDMRRNKMNMPNTPEVKFRSSHSTPKKQVAGSDSALRVGERCSGQKSMKCIKWLPPHLRKKQCVFCGRKKAQYKCRACKMHLCLQISKDKPGLRYRTDGPTCFLRFHGIDSFGSN